MLGSSGGKRERARLRGQGAPAQKAPQNRFNSHSMNVDISNWSNVDISNWSEGKGYCAGEKTVNQ